MVTFDLLQFIAVAVMACGLLAILLEIVLRNPRWLWEIVTDVRRFAVGPVEKLAERNEAPAPTAKSAKSRDPLISA
jgi:hypothetical protein